MHAYMVVYGHMYTYILHLGAKKVCKTFSQCIHTQKAGALHQADTAMVQCYPISMQNAVVPAQLP